ncbi:MAG TPA: YqaE/Pmp3 family membrane protein [Rhodothermales bacterium]|nr:YqaE/Pmp3 family membrane protein [Rhodothermales bacterium]
MKLSRLFLCLILPPLAVYSRTGPARPFYLNLLLTLLFYLPGLLHALSVESRSR